MANSVGIYVQDNMGSLPFTILDGKDFMIAKIGDKETFVNTYIPMAYNHSPRVPFIAFYEWDLQPYMEMTLNEDRWPSPENDPNMKLLDTYLGYKNGYIFRAVNGIMLNFSNTKFTPSWNVAMADHAIKMIWTRYKLPNYIYMDKNPYMTADTAGKSIISSWALKQEGLSVPYMSIEAKYPQIPFEINKWFFWIYGINENKTLAVKYNGSKASLYSELLFTDYSNTEETTSTEETSTSAVSSEQNSESFESRLIRAITAFCNAWTEQ